jgi:hypothetical protein
METAISSIDYLPNFSRFGSVSPAIVNRETGKLYINQSVWRSLPVESRLFVLLHEAGHATLQTTSEHEADEWAFQQYASLGYPLTKSIYALSRVLKFNKIEDYERLSNQYSRAATYDFHVNKNSKAMDLPVFSNKISSPLYVKNKSEKLMPQADTLFSANDGNDFGPPNYDYGAKTEPGANLGAWLNNIGSGLNSLAQAFATGVGAIKGGQITNTGELAFPGQSTPVEDKKKDYTMLIIGLAITAILVVGVTVFIIKKKK